MPAALKPIQFTIRDDPPRFLRVVPRRRRIGRWPIEESNPNLEETTVRHPIDKSRGL
jgi:hypothetical protein